MPKKCDFCGFFSPENSWDACPECGEKLQFTMFAPPGYHTAEADAPPSPKAWDVNTAAFEHLELPWGVRWGQVLAGIGIYGVISHTVRSHFLALCFDGETQLSAQHALIAIVLITLAFHVIGALAGGAVAGAWSVNWLPQGIGVGIGVFLTPFVLFVLFGPGDKVSVAVFLTVLAITTGISVLGAFIGHKMIRPSRYVIS
jgi:hypothetical protein